MVQRDRLHWIDFTKALGIFLIVLGHTRGLPTILHNVIYAFHVPLFLIVTGFLLTPKLPMLGPREIVRHLLPYVKLYAVFTVFSVLVKMALEPLYRPLGLFDSLGEVFVNAAYGVAGRDVALPNAPLWYFTFLTASLLVFWIALRAGRLAGTVPWFSGLLLLPAALFGLFQDGSYSPWYINYAGIGALFIWTGFLAKDYLPRLETAMDRLPETRRLLVVFGLLLAIAVSGALNGSVNINRAHFGESHVLFFANAVLGTLGVIMIGMLLPPFRILEVLSENTLVIFSVHILLAPLILIFLETEPSRLVKVMGVFAFAVGLTVVSLGLSLLIMPVLRRTVMRRAA